MAMNGAAGAPRLNIPNTPGLREGMYGRLARFRNNHRVISGIAKHAGSPLLGGGALAAADVFLLSGGVVEITAVVLAVMGGIWGRLVGGHVANRCAVAERNVEIRRLEIGTGEGELKRLQEELDAREKYIKHLTEQGAAEGKVRYQKVSLKGRGAQGIVLEVLDRVFPGEEPVVLKMPRIATVLEAGLTKTEIERWLKRLVTEAQNLKRLSHDNIVGFKMFDLITAEHYNSILGEGEREQQDKLDLDRVKAMEIEIPVIVMEEVEGRDIEKDLGIDQMKGRKGFNLKFAGMIMQRIASILVELKKKGVIHRDIKPQNIVLTPEGKPILIDFGTARPPEGSGTLAGYAIGSKGYMAPEQMGATVELELARRLMKVPVTWKADLYGAGATFWQMLTGEIPNTPAWQLWLISEDEENCPADEQERKQMVDRIFATPVPSIEAKLREIQSRLVTDLNLIMQRIHPQHRDANLNQVFSGLKELQNRILTGLQKMFNKTLAIDPRQRYDDLAEPERDLVQIMVDNERYQQNLDILLSFSNLGYEDTASGAPAV